MKLARTLAVGLATVGTSIAVAPTAAAQPGTCVVTFDPWDGRSYAAAAVVDGQVQHIITRQSGMLDDGPVTVTYTAPSGIVGDPAGVTEVWWAARDPAKRNVAADFHDVLHVRPDCTFVEAYHAIPGRRDSVAIRRDRIPTPTLPVETTTTTGAAPTTSTTSTPPDTAVPPPTVTFSTTPAPTTTTSPVELYTATSVARTGTLPATGINALRALWGVGLMTAGVALWAGSHLCRRRLARTVTGKKVQP